MQKKFAAAFLALAFAFANFGILPVLAAGSATVSLQPSLAAMKVGDTLSVKVMINPNGASLDTVRLDLGYDAKKLQALSFSLDGMFPNLSPSNSINNTAGTLSYGAFKFGTAVSTAGTLGTVSFKALAATDSTKISVLDSSKLISDGSENINISGSVSTLVAIGATTIPAKPTAEPAKPATPAVPATSATPATPVTGGVPVISAKDATAAAKIVLKHVPKTAAELAAVACLVDGGCKGTRNLAAEKVAITKFVKLFKKSPKTSLDWNVVNTLAYTNYFTPGAKLPAKPVVPAVPAKPATPAVPATPAKKVISEKEAKASAKIVLGHEAKSAEELEAVKCLQNGCKGEKRDLVAEKAAIAKFVKLFKKSPKTDLDWNVVNTIAYTTHFNPPAKTPAKPATPAVPATPAKPATPATPVVTALKLDKTNQAAAGWFTKLAGHTPTTLAADSVALDYMMHGYTPATRNLDHEATAIKLFSKTFGHVPSSTTDWNIIAAIAYSGAFKL